MSAPRSEPHDPLLGPEEVAAVLGLSAYTVRRMMRDRELPGMKLGKPWRVRDSTLRAWIDEKERPA